MDIADAYELMMKRLIENRRKSGFVNDVDAELVGDKFVTLPRDGATVNIRNWVKEQRRGMREGKISKFRFCRLDRLVSEGLFRWGSGDMKRPRNDEGNQITKKHKILKGDTSDTDTEGSTVQIENNEFIESSLEVTVDEKSHTALHVRSREILRQLSRASSILTTSNLSITDLNAIHNSAFDLLLQIDRKRDDNSDKDN